MYLFILFDTTTDCVFIVSFSYLLLLHGFIQSKQNMISPWLNKLKTFHFSKIGIFNILVVYIVSNNGFYLLNIPNESGYAEKNDEL